MKSIAIFDLDGTLAESKQPIDAEMGGLLASLLDHMAVAVISGGDWPQFDKQLLGRLPDVADLSRLFLLPTSGSKFFQYERRWRQIYADELTETERSAIYAALLQAIAAIGLDAGQSWGDRIEDRGTQITFSGLGQQAPLDQKRSWDPDLRKRQRLKAFLEPKLPAFSIRIGGATSLDITRRGVDKAYGLARFAEVVSIRKDEMMFFGDAVFAGGNDAPVRAAGIATVPVALIGETKTAIRTIIACGPPLSTHF
ncbi:haloacid dehalogenase [Novosphingobium marinum]|jgi:HAD superfamily hydrolase (TIGR01484 family)|uniref:phosphomannomutase n=1 Tax=Novosphingobium marinum TaxID=1514948 RepID=A0A7Y9XXW3_9SPHN|nr:HAD-IIB family hydrolase [Novosphingobium marinum]NYH96612.1 hypothetical protein [Novosphingobium marinum]GGC39690.1 haloacid dehalogenase [Novosphingobium marinum]